MDKLSNQAEQKANSPEWNAAMAIINFVCEKAGVSVDVRQRINDECDDFAIKEIRDYHLSKQVEQQPILSLEERIELADKITSSGEGINRYLDLSPRVSNFLLGFDAAMRLEQPKKLLHWMEIATNGFEQVEPKVSVPSDEDWNVLQERGKNLCFNAPFVTGDDIVTLVKDWHSKITSNSVPKQWISVEECLPELEKDVLLFDDWKTIEGESRQDFRVGYLKEFSTRKTSAGLTNYCEWSGEFVFNITHWMPLPKLPNTPNQE